MFLLKMLKTCFLQVFVCVFVLELVNFFGGQNHWGDFTQWSYYYWAMLVVIVILGWSELPPVYTPIQKSWLTGFMQPKPPYCLMVQKSPRPTTWDAWNPVNYIKLSDKPPIKWCRMSSINSMSFRGVWKPLPSSLSYNMSPTIALMIMNSTIWSRFLFMLIS